MTKQEIESRLEAQRAFFAAGNTRSADERIRVLKKLYSVLKESEAEINAALKADVGKSKEETYMVETGMVLSEITHMLRHIRGYMRKRHAVTPLAQFASSSYQLPSPYGAVLVMSPWNYPLMLSLEPLADAVAAGNTVMLKPSAYSPETSALLEKLIAKAFPKEWVTVITGGRAENEALLECRFDYIFFTGSVAVGKLVMRKAAEHLTPVTLELGGKSPCIVDATADIALAARRIAWGKFLNLGQTCVAPDYILCDASIKEKLIEALKKEITRQYGADPLANADYGRIVNRKHFERVKGLTQSGRLVFGGQSDEAALRIAPTILDDVRWDDAVMGEEIFGPVLPVLTYDTLDGALEKIAGRPHPLALYFFSKDKAAQKKVMDTAQYGGGCINDTVIHLATSAMPFGGVGGSGMGCYHGKAGFDTFTHYKSVVDKKCWLDLPMRYQPYKQIMMKLIRMFLK